MAALDNAVLTSSHVPDLQPWKKNVNTERNIWRLYTCKITYQILTVGLPMVRTTWLWRRRRSRPHFRPRPNLDGSLLDQSRLQVIQVHARVGSRSRQ